MQPKTVHVAGYETAKPSVCLSVNPSVIMTPKPIEMLQVSVVITDRCSRLPSQVQSYQYVGRRKTSHQLSHIDPFYRFTSGFDLSSDCARV